MTDNIIPVWEFICLLCGLEGDDPLIAEEVAVKGQLVALQEHAMRVHGVTQGDFRFQGKEEIVPGEFFRWKLPDGREWLEADVPATPEDYRPMPIPEMAGNQKCTLCSNERATHVLFDKRPGRERKGHTLLGPQCMKRVLGLAEEVVETG